MLRGPELISLLLLFGKHPLGLWIVSLCFIDFTPEKKTQGPGGQELPSKPLFFQAVCSKLQIETSTRLWKRSLTFPSSTPETGRWLRLWWLYCILILKWFLHEEETCFCLKTRSGLFPVHQANWRGVPLHQSFKTSVAGFFLQILQPRFSIPCHCFLVGVFNTTFEIETTAEKKTKVTRVLWILPVLPFVISRMLWHLCDVSALLESSGAMMLNYWEKQKQHNKISIPCLFEYFQTYINI